LQGKLPEPEPLTKIGARKGIPAVIQREKKGEERGKGDNSQGKGDGVVIKVEVQVLSIAKRGIEE